MIFRSETARLMLTPVKDNRNLGLKIGGFGPEKYFAFGGANMRYLRLPQYSIEKT
jgi:hypothetical protein